MSYISNGQKVSAGRQGLAAYHNVMIEWYGGKYNLSYEQLEKTVLGRNPDFYAQLGDAIITAKIGQRRLKEAMERVVEKTTISPLSIPWVSTFITGVADEISDFDWSLVGDASLDLAVSVGKKFEAVGDAAGSVVSGVGNTIKTASFILPLVLLFVVGVAGMALFNIGKNVKKVSDVRPI